MTFQTTAIAFGSAGSSWFVKLSEKGEKMTGLRWTPAHYARCDGRGSWRLVTVDRDVVTSRVPTCSKPVAPTQELVNQFYVAELERKAENRAKTKAVKAIQVRLDAGEHVIMTHTFKTWDGVNHKLISAMKLVEVIGTKGMKVLCKGPTENGYYFGHRHIEVEYLS